MNGCYNCDNRIQFQNVQGYTRVSCCKKTPEENRFGYRVIWRLKRKPLWCPGDQQNDMPGRNPSGKQTQETEGVVE